MKSTVQTIDTQRDRLSAAEVRTRGGPRYAFVDLLRGLALVVMIETHVVNAYLPMPARNTISFFWLSFINGLVAPSFLFASGFSLTLQARRQWEHWLHLDAAFWKHVRRLGFILLVGYYLHLPHLGISKFLSTQDLTFWKKALQVDVLHCIVVSLLVADILILAARKPVRFAWAAAFVGMGAALVTPWMWSQDFSSRLPLAVALFLNPNGVSLFPLFPWISFVMAGCCAAHFFLAAVSRGRDIRYMRRILIISAATIAGALIIRYLALFRSWEAGFYTTSPLYVVIRIACVLVICAGLYLMEKRLGWVPQVIRLAGQESLLVYSAHLILIFSVLRRTQAAAIIGRQAGYPGCLLLSAALVVLTIGMARIWHSWKRNHPRSARAALLAIIAVNVVIFVLR